MGKIKVRTIGTEEEALEKKEAKHKSEIKKDKKTHLSGMGGGERVVSVGPTEEELKKLEEKEKQEKTEGEPTKKGKKTKSAKKRIRSKGYQLMVQMIDKSKVYPLNEALELLEKMKSPAKQDSALQKKNFDETVELHINTHTPGISGNITLPHGSGKKTRVAIVDDALIAEIEKGKIDFDILISSPVFMSKLAKVARILGPKGLMPNPKNGTITEKPEEAAKKYEGGQISFKTESKSPIIHLSVGKVSYGSKKLSENVEVILGAVKKENILNAVLKSTMSPAIKLSL